MNKSIRFCSYVFSLMLILQYTGAISKRVSAQEKSAPDRQETNDGCTDEVGTGMVFDTSFLLRLPDADDIFVAFSLPAGVNGSGNIRVHGGAHNDNLYLCDGIDTTEPLTSMLGAVPYADTVDTVSILTGAFPAEYGRSMGGIIDISTRSGTDDLHGILRYKNVNSNSRDSDQWKHYRTLPDYDYQDYAVTIDGPVVKDKLWFMVSYHFYTKEKTAHWGYWNDWEDWGYSFGSRSIDQDQEYRFPMARLTFQPSADHRIAVVVNWQSYEWNNFSGPQYNATPETYNTLEQTDPFYGVEWTWQVSRDLELNTLIGTYFRSYDDKPTGENDSDPSFYDTYTQMSYNNSDHWTEDERQRYQYRMTADYRITDLFGSHEWKAGIEYQRQKTDNMFKIPGGVSYVITQTPVGDPADPDYFTGDSATRMMQYFPGSTRADGTYLAVFVQDEWQVTDCIKLLPGIRYETVRYKNSDGDSNVAAWRWGDFKSGDYLKWGMGQFGEFEPLYTAPMEFDTMIAPRIAAEWELLEDRTWLSAFWGRYYDPFDMSLPAMFQPFDSDPYATFNQEYTGPAWTDRDKNGIPDESHFFDDANWTTWTGNPGGSSNLIDPDLEPEYTDEVSVGIRHQLTRDICIGLSYTNRKTRNLIEDTGLFADQDGNIVWTYRGGVTDDFSGLDPGKKYDPRENGKDYIHHLYWITNAEGNRRDYSGIDMTASIHKPRWDLIANYTWSEAKGTVIESAPGSSGVSQFSGQYDTYATSLNLYGELPWSCRHYLKMAGSCHFDLTDWYEIGFGINAFLRSGYAYSKRSNPPFTYDPDSASNVYEDPTTWTGRPPYRSYPWYHPEGRGTCDLPSYYSIDVSWRNTFSIGNYGSLTLILDVGNVTDYQGILSESDLYIPTRPALFGQQNDWGTPREYRWSLAYRF